ncbi:MAG TPA: hypothetical protein VLN56_09790 [Gammaproteobacteria bacterium]|nr:hypothetical protein [Gammaproteobacteria bacterium]
MADDEPVDDLQLDIDEAEKEAGELAFLFGEEIVEQAQLVDIADLNLTDEMTNEIGAGVRRLKELKNNPEAQRRWISEQTPGLQLVLCLWIMDMDLLGKLQKHS